MDPRLIDEFPHWPAGEWGADLPSGEIRSIYLHWSGFDYTHVFTSYHYCIALVDGAPFVVQTHDLRANMRDVYAAAEPPYAAHTFRRNTFAAGISIMGMGAATPHDFGEYPLTETAIEALAYVAALIARAYGIPLDGRSIMTHAEAAVADGYFGTADEERWDIARLRPSAVPLTEQDAASTGDELRRRIATAHRRLTRRG